MTKNLVLSAFYRLRKIMGLRDQQKENFFPYLYYTAKPTYKCLGEIKTFQHLRFLRETK